MKTTRETKQLINNLTRDTKKDIIKWQSDSVDSQETDYTTKINDVEILLQRCWGFHKFVLSNSHCRLYLNGVEACMSDWYLYALCRAVEKSIIRAARDKVEEAPLREELVKKVLESINETAPTKQTQ
jgi:hypothetical protein